MPGYSNSAFHPDLKCGGCSCRSVDRCVCYNGCTEPAHTQTPADKAIAAQARNMTYPVSHIEVDQATATDLRRLEVTVIEGHRVIVIDDLPIPWRVETYEPVEAGGWRKAEVPMSSCR
jgi:hypothetical protein